MLLASGLVVASLFALWIAIHHVPWLGPALADGTRAVVGPAPVAWAEDAAYAWQDRYDRWRHGDDAPHTYWEVPPAGAAETPPAVTSSTSDTAPEAVPSSFPPPSFTPPHKHVASKSDGQWVAMSGRAAPGGKALMAKAMVHPDRERPYTVIAVVAMDLARIRIHAVPGTIEPRGDAFPAERRTGTVPEREQDLLIAAFNGGFQTIHGGYAMMVDGIRLGDPRDDACTVALYPDGRIRIRSWPVLAADAPNMAAFRQTPRCLVEQGERHPELENAYNTSWGAVVGGGTVVRRSALGVSADGMVLFFGMGDSLTARSLADGMRAAGAHDVAQLDVNHVFPRFLLFDVANGGEVQAVQPLCSGFSFSSGDYVRVPMPRDFFYVTRASD